MKTRSSIRTKIIVLVFSLVIVCIACTYETMTASQFKLTLTWLGLGVIGCVLIVNQIFLEVGYLDTLSYNEGAKAVSNAFKKA